MTELQISLKILLANTLAMYFKTHGFHWNVEGVHFSQYHEFFNELYEDIYGAVDPTAEQLRKLSVYAPSTLTEILMSKTINESSIVGNDVKGMLSALLVDNDEVLSTLNKVFAVATASDEQGICNFIADRIDIHKKHGWQIRSSLKGM